jgi:hypothetical protein
MEPHKTAKYSKSLDPDEMEPHKTAKYSKSLDPDEMEPHRTAKYSKSLDPDETEEVLMNEDSDEELEDRDEMMEPRIQSSLSSEDDEDTEEIEDTFRATRPGDWSNILDFTGPPSGVNRSVASDRNAESSPF